MGRFELWAMKDILPGQALTMDYASTEDYLFKQFPCLCGAPNCRKWITGRREPVRIPDLDADGR
jgi:SET domain-containing protein